MVAGIVLFAFAMRATLVHVGSDLDTVRAFGLCCGPALYLSAYVGLRFRVSRTLGRGRLIAAVVCAAAAGSSSSFLLWRPLVSSLPSLSAPRVRAHLVARVPCRDSSVSPDGLWILSSKGEHHLPKVSLGSNRVDCSIVCLSKEKPARPIFRGPYGSPFSRPGPWSLMACAWTITLFLSCTCELDSPAFVLSFTDGTRRPLAQQRSSACLGPPGSPRRCQSV